MQSEQLFISAGADRVYLIDELNATQVGPFYRGYQQNAWHSLMKEPACHAVIEKLITLGALYYSRPVHETLRVAVQWAGKPSQTFIEWLDLLCKRRTDIEVVGSTALDVDLVLVIRTNDTLQNASAKTSHEVRPHLLIDLAYHSTLVVGPFVVPGHTACLGCIAGRLTHLWGDMQPPEQPTMNTHIELTVAVIMEHIEIFHTRGTINALVGNTWALDITTWESRFHPVFRLPWCPICAKRGLGIESGQLSGVF